MFTARPGTLRSDNGPEFVSRAILRWLGSANIETVAIDPGKPWQNGLNESFNGKFRDECLAMEWFKNRIDAKIVIETFRRGYNEVRPHSSLGQLTPVGVQTESFNNQPGPSHFLETSGPKNAGRSHWRQLSESSAKEILLRIAEFELMLAVTFEDSRCTIVPMLI